MVYTWGAWFWNSRGTGLHALDHEGAQHDGSGTVAGDTQGEHGDHGAAGHGVVACLRGADALGSAVAELLLVLGPALGLVIGDEGGDVPAGAGHCADYGADDGRAEDGDCALLQVCYGGKDPLQLHIMLNIGLVVGVLDGGQHLGESEQANQHGDKGETAQQVGGAEGHAHLAAHGVDADSGDDKSDPRRPSGP